MSEPAQHHAINYIEFTTTDIAGTKAFYEKAFSWNFQEYGPDYIAFDRDHAGIDGGFRKGDPRSEPERYRSTSCPLLAGPESHAGCHHRRRWFHRRSHLRLPRRKAIPLLRRPGQRSSRLVRVASTNPAKTRCPEVYPTPGHLIPYSLLPVSQFISGAGSAFRFLSSSRTSDSPRMQRSNPSDNRANKGASFSYSNILNWLTMK